MRSERARRATKAASAPRTAVLAVLHGALLDLLATGDDDRVTRAEHLELARLAG